MQHSGEFFVKGEIIVLKRDGTWVTSPNEASAARQEFTEITHEETKKLFYRAIEWDTTRRIFTLKVGFERIEIRVEDTPYFVTGIERDNGKLLATLTNESTCEITIDNLHYEKNSLYLDLDSGLRAKFFSAPYYETLKMLEENESEYFLLIKNSKCVLLSKERMKE